MPAHIRRGWSCNFLTLPDVFVEFVFGGFFGANLRKMHDVKKKISKKFVFLLF
jgi:hypothetical protein